MSKPEQIGAVRCKCTECEYSTLDEKWGEIKCKKLHIRIHSPSVICDKFKKKVEKK